MGFPPYETFGSMEPSRAQGIIAEVCRLVGRVSMMAGLSDREPANCQRAPGAGHLQEPPSRSWAAKTGTGDHSTTGMP